jgi:hypothetical protein
MRSLAWSRFVAAAVVSPLCLAGCGLTLDLDPQPEGGALRVDGGGRDGEADAARDARRPDGARLDGAAADAGTADGAAGSDGGATEPLSPFPDIEPPTATTDELVVMNDGTFDTDTVTFMPLSGGDPMSPNGGVVRTDSPCGGFAYVAAKSVTIESSVRVVGSRPLVIVARDDIRIGTNATIDLAAEGSQPGPGGFAGGRSDAGQGPGAGGSGSRSGDASAGGGGAGHGAIGGAGGASSALPGGQPGPARGGFAQLCGGSGGGSAAFEGHETAACGPARGGGGGGALLLLSEDRIEILGTITAAGGGGAGSSGCGGGGGGGSGGYIAAAAPRIVVRGIVAANGGGGGGGGQDTGPSATVEPATPGEGGCACAEPASGGVPTRDGDMTLGGAGGFGGAGEQLRGQAGLEHVVAGGGGGGAVGRVLFRYRDELQIRDGALLSPAQGTAAVRVTEIESD